MRIAKRERFKQLSPYVDHHSAKKQECNESQVREVQAKRFIQENQGKLTIPGSIVSRALIAKFLPKTPPAVL